MIIIVLVLLALLSYLCTGIAVTIEWFLPWMYEEMEHTAYSPTVYKSLAWQTVFLWPRVVHADLKARLKEQNARKK